MYICRSIWSRNLTAVGAFMKLGHHTIVAWPGILAGYAEVRREVPGEGVRPAAPPR